jgi:glycine cleavage system aminomethyltransferase T
MAAIADTRCGYTGEDGFEMLMPAEHADAFAESCCQIIA